MTDGVTLSLDRLAGIVDIDPERKQVTAWGGTRLRDLTPALLDAGLAFHTLASHDAQSIAGILAGLGPDDDLFWAAVDGIGAVGVITKATFQVGDAFHLRQGTFVESGEWAEEHLDELFEANEHVSFYAYPYTDRLHVHTWTRTDDPRSRLGAFRESLNEVKAAVVAATLGDAMAHWGLLPRLASWAMRLQRPTRLVLHSHEAFSRSQYHLHQELEVAVPRERVWSDLQELLDLYEQRATTQRLPFLLVEVRFTPGPHETSFLGPGVGRDTAWLCLCLNQSGAVGNYFADVEEWVRRTDARAHLGKWCEDLDADDLQRMHGDRLDRFQAVRRRLDPEGKFTNAYVDRALGRTG